MQTRRQTLLGAAVGVAGTTSLIACSSSSGYEAAVQALWRHGSAPPGDRPALLRELVRYSTLAPSSHNTQCWKFAVEDQAISILPDLSRRCPVVDPDDHHLYVSLGCAAENLVQAALDFGLKGEVSFDAVRDAVRVSLVPTQAVASPLFKAITERQCTRAEYDGKPLSNEELALLKQAGTGDGVELVLQTDKAAMEKTLAYIVEGNTAQLNDPAFVDELKKWIRFNGNQAVKTGDGLYGASSGNPSIPAWLGDLIFGMLITAKAENEKCEKQVRSSAGIAVFVAAVADKAHWVEVGRCYERFALQATALGVRNAFLNQPVEVTALRPRFASELGLGNRRPNLVVRFGRTAKMPASLRRPVQDVIV